MLQPTDPSVRHRAALFHAEGTTVFHGHLRQEADLLAGRDINITMPPTAAGSPVSVAPPLGKRVNKLQGRDDIVQMLVGLLEHPHDRPRVRVLHGLGGCGKTSIALEVANRAVEAGIPVWWVEPRDESTVKDSMEAVALQAGVRRADLKERSLPDVLWRRLNRRREPWLLVVDNAEDVSLLGIGGVSVTMGTGWIREPSQGPGLVVITSRDGTPATWGSWPRHLVPVLEAGPAAQILLDSTAGRPGARAAAEVLAGRLGGLPLALHLAGKYLAMVSRYPWLDDTFSTFDDYRVALGQGRLELLADRDGEHDIHRVWELSLDLLEHRGLTQARALLRLLSCLSDAPIPYPLVLHPATLATSELFPGMTGNELPWLFEGLAGLGLLDMSEDSGGEMADGPPVLSIHPLVRATSRHHLSETSDPVSYLSVAAALMHRAAQQAGDPENPLTWPSWHLLAPHCTDLLRDLAAHPASGLPVEAVGQAAAAAHRAAVYQYASGLYEQAELEFREVLGARHRILGKDGARTLGEDNASTLETRSWIACLLRERDQLDTAEDELRTVYEAQKALLGEKHLDTLQTYNQLAIVLAYQGKSNEAKDVYEAVYQARREILGDDHHGTLSSRVGLACRLYYEGKLDAAEHSFRAVYSAECQDPEFGPDHPETLTTREWLARIARERGRFDEAAAEFRVIWSARRRVQRDDHPDVRHIQDEFAGVLIMYGRQLLTAGQSLVNPWEGRAEMTDHGDGAAEKTPFDQAMAPLQEALGLIDADADAHFYGVVLHDIADVHKAARRLEDAAATFLQAAESKRRSPSVDSQSLAITLYAAGEVHELLGGRGQEGAYDQALAAFEESHRLMESLNASNPMERVVVLKHMASVLDAVGRSSEAAVVTSQVAEILAQQATIVMSEGDIRTILTLADYLVDYGKLSEAWMALERASDLLNMDEQSVDRSRADTLHAVGALYERLGNRGLAGAYKEALTNYQSALALLDADAEPSAYGIVLHDIGDVHRAESRMDEAISAYETAAEHKRRDGDNPSGLASTLRALGVTRLTLLKARKGREKDDGEG